jgi:two-component system, NtrC family, sensor kinase
LNNFHETILMNIPGVIVVTDLDNKIVFTNTAFGKLVAKRAQDYLGKLFSESFSHLQGQSEFLADELSKPLETSEMVKHPEFRKNKSISNYSRDPLIAQASKDSTFIPPSVITLSNQFFTYEIFDAGVCPNGNQLKGLILNDITKEKDFLDRMTQAENISSLKTLAAGISHEISNPLHSILTFSEALCHESDLDKVKLYAGKVAGNSERLGKVLTDFSGYVQSKENGVQKDVQVNKIIDTAIKFALLPHQDKNIVLDKNFNSLPNFNADPEELQQIFFNIINNAFQAMKGNGRLKVSSYIENEFLVIKFEDDGPGMPNDILRKAFNPFFTTKMQGEGTGLGLNITQRLVEKYGGSIKIQSQENKGTTVSLFFPNPDE